MISTLDTAKVIQFLFKSLNSAPKQIFKYCHKVGWKNSTLYLRWELGKNERDGRAREAGWGGGGVQPPSNFS